MNYLDVLKKVYEFYPRGIDYFNNENVINKKYSESFENKKLTKLLSNRNSNFCDEFIKEINSKYKYSLRDISNLHMGDRCFNLQFSDFFFKNKLKYYPVCFSFSLILPLYYVYIIDIDISFDKPIQLGTYNWVANNGLLKKNDISIDLMTVISQIEKYIIKHTDYKKISNSLAERIIPDISNEYIKMGNFTVFNALFLDDYFCFP